MYSQQNIGNNTIVSTRAYERSELNSVMCVRVVVCTMAYSRGELNFSTEQTLCSICKGVHSIKLNMTSCQGDLNSDIMTSIRRAQYWHHDMLKEIFIMISCQGELTLSNVSKRWARTQTEIYTQSHTHRISHTHNLTQAISCTHTISHTQSHTSNLSHTPNLTLSVVNTHSAVYARAYTQQYK
jgi:hypothetical protein